ncbi:MAG: peptidase C39 [bacterium]|nr:peptidase C39 [bacterium]
MFINYSLFAAIPIGIILYIAGFRLLNLALFKENRVLKIFIIFLFFLLSLPCFSFILYYLHLVREPVWYLEFRSIHNIEIISAFIGLFIGSIIDEIPFIRDRNSLKRIGAIVTLFFIFIPYCKPVLLPVNYDTRLKPEWKDNVRLQSTGSTCGPAALATVFSFYGIQKEEYEIAKASYTCATGTENWYLARYANNNGLTANFYYKDSLSQVPVPSIIGTNIGGIGHFVVLLGTDPKENKIIIGDPLVGRLNLTLKAFKRRYRFKNLAIHIRLSN